MKRIVLACVALAAALALDASATFGDKAAPVTLEGDLMCAKCTLKEKDATECQDVLVVKAAEKKAEDLKYYLAKNEVSEEYGMVCTDTRPVRITGTVAEKDGRKWLAASKIENLTNDAFDKRMELSHAFDSDFRKLANKNRKVNGYDDLYKDAIHLLRGRVRVGCTDERAHELARNPERRSRGNRIAARREHERRRIAGADGFEQLLGEPRLSDAR